MARIITFGEIMLRLATPGHLRFSQAHEFEVLRPLRMRSCFDYLNI